MSNYTKGIEVELTLDGEKVIQELKTIDSRLITIRKELGQLKQSLEAEWDISKFQRAQELAQQSVEDTQAKVNALKQRLDELNSSAQIDDDLGKQIAEVSKELAYAENAARKAQEELESLNRIRLDKLSSSIKEAGENIIDMGSSLTSKVTLPLMAAGTAAVKYATDTQEAINKVDVSFGESAENIKQWSEVTLEAYGISRTSALDMAAYFGDMSTSMGLTQAKAAQMSKEIVGWIGDISSFKNVSLDVAKTAASAIWTGETESIKQLGVVMTEANLEAYALANGYDKLYKEMSQGEKVMLRFNYVMDSTQNATGDFARTSDNTANQLRILQESLKELAASFGEELLPIIQPILQNINDLIQKFASLDEQTKQNIVRWAIAAATLGPLLKITGEMTKGIGSLISLFPLLIAKLKAKQAADVGATASQNALNAAMNANPIMLVVSAIGFLISILGSLAVANSIAQDSTDRLIGSTQRLSEETNDAVQSIEEDTTAKMTELAMIEQLLPKIEELNNKTNRTASEQELLKSMVAQVNEVMPGLIGEIDSATNSFNLNTQAIRNNIDAYKDYLQAQSKQQIAQEKYKAAAEADLNINDIEKELRQLYDKGIGGKILKEYGQDYYEKAFSEFKVDPIRVLERNSSFLENVGNAASVMWGSVFGDPITDAMHLADELREAQKEADKLRSDADGLLEELKNDASLSYNGPGVSETDTVGGKSGGETLSDVYQDERNQLRHMRNMGIYEDEQYYNKLLALKRKYAADLAQDELWSLEEEIYNLSQTIYKARQKALEEQIAAEKERISDLKSEYEEFTNEIISLAQEAAEEKIKAIEEEVAARNKLLEQQKLEKQLEQAQAKLSYERDAENRSELQKEIACLQKEVEEQKYQASIEAQKEAIQAEVEQLKLNAAAIVEQFNKAIDPTGITQAPAYNNTTIQSSINLAQPNMTPAQLEAVIKKVFDDLIKQV